MIVHQSPEPGGDSKIPDRLLTYLVHDGWWPPPPSVPGPLPLPPVTFPPARWYSLPLDAAQIDAKLAALESHGTQAAMMDRLHNQALADGYPATVLASSPMGLPLYNKLGYRHEGYQIGYAFPNMW